MTHSKINVVVLSGGRSSEHAISLQSAAVVMQNLDRSRFDVTPVLIDSQGQWLFAADSLSNSKPGSPEKKMLLSPEKNLYFAATLKKNLDFCDVIFPVLHGAYGEDGTLQGLLEFLDIPYVGANTLGSAVAMDKVLSKRLVVESGVPVVPFVAFNQGQWELNAPYYSQKIHQELSYPLFVKPVNTGSSVGITRVVSPETLASAIETALLYDSKVLVEQALSVREIEVAVLENQQWGQSPLLSVCGEIIPRHAFYSYEAKYLDPNGAKLVIPAHLSKKQLVQLQDFAQRTFEALACQGMARIDFFIDKQTDTLYFNEINTIPGFTQISMYPKLWEASGLSFTHLLSRLLELAMARYTRQAKLKRTYQPSVE